MALGAKPSGVKRCWVTTPPPSPPSPLMSTALYEMINFNLSLFLDTLVERAGCPRCTWKSWEKNAIKRGRHEKV